MSSCPPGSTVQSSIAALLCAPVPGCPPYPFTLPKQLPLSMTIDVPVTGQPRSSDIIVQGVWPSLGAGAATATLQLCNYPNWCSSPPQPVYFAPSTWPAACVPVAQNLTLNMVQASPPSELTIANISAYYVNDTADYYGGSYINSGQPLPGMFSPPFVTDLQGYVSCPNPVAGCKVNTYVGLSAGDGCLKGPPPGIDLPPPTPYPPCYMTMGTTIGISAALVIASANNFGAGGASLAMPYLQQINANVNCIAYLFINVLDLQSVADTQALYLHSDPLDGYLLCDAGQILVNRFTQYVFGYPVAAISIGARLTVAYAAARAPCIPYPTATPFRPIPLPSIGVTADTCPPPATPSAINYGSPAPVQILIDEALTNSNPAYNPLCPDGIVECEPNNCTRCPQTLTLTFSGCTGICLDGTYPLAWNGGNDIAPLSTYFENLAWSWSGIVGNCTVQFFYYCGSNSLYMYYQNLSDCSTTGISQSGSSSSCPFLISGSWSATVTCGTSTYNIALNWSLTE